MNPGRTDSGRTDSGRTGSGFTGSGLTDSGPDDGPRGFTGPEVLPPRVYAPGRYQFTGPSVPAHPPDPVAPFIAPPVPRRRRSDWPVLVSALIVAAIILGACCIAGYVLFATKGAPGL